MDGRFIKLTVVLVCLAVGAALSWTLLRIKPTQVGTGEGADAVRQAKSYRFRRIICASPALAEIAFALGAGNRIVAVSEFTTYPPEAAVKPTCGGLVNPNYELILSLKPDLILSQSSTGELADFAREHGMTLEANELSDMASIFSAIMRVGRVIEAEDEARALCARMMDAIQAAGARASEQAPVRVLVVAGREPGSLTGIYAAGPGTFLDDAIRAAGGVNVLADLSQTYAAVNKEALIERRPEVIVELHGEGRDEAAQQAEARRLWTALPSLPAVQNGRVYVLEGTYALIPGPRVVTLVQRLAELFHAEGAQ